MDGGGLVAFELRTKHECAHCLAQPPTNGSHHYEWCPRYEKAEYTEE